MPPEDLHIGLYSRQFHNPTRRGVAIYCRELVQALSKVLRHTKVSLLDCFWPTAHFAHLPRISNPNFDTKVMRIPGRVFDVLNKNLGWPKLDLLSDDLGLIHLMGEDLPVTKAKNTITTVHGCGPILYPEFFSSAFRSNWKHTLDRCLERAVKVIAVSETLRKLLCEYRPEFSGKYETTFLGVSRQFLAEPDKDQEKHLLATKGIHFPYILYIGAADPGKNLVGFLDAFSIFINETKPRRPHHLVLVGNQDWGGYEVLEKKIEAESIHDRVHFAGYVDQKDLPAFYRGSELFAYPSLFEGFGLPLLEAMAAGAPCLTSNRPALTEVGADVAEYCDPTSVQDMSMKLKNLIEDPEKLSDMRLKGRQYARRFTWERTALSTIRIYEDVLGAPII